MGSLLSHESRIDMEEKSLQNFFQTRAFIDGGWGRGRWGRGGRRITNQRTQQQSNPKQSRQSDQPRNSQNLRRSRKWTDKSKVQCFYCKRFGHYESECKRKQWYMIEAERMSPLLKKGHLRQCFSHARSLKIKATMIYGCWTVDAAIIWLATKICFLA